MRVKTTVRGAAMMLLTLALTGCVFRNVHMPPARDPFYGLDCSWELTNSETDVILGSSTCFRVNPAWDAAHGTRSHGRPKWLKEGK